MSGPSFECLHCKDGQPARLIAPTACAWRPSLLQPLAQLKELEMLNVPFVPGFGFLAGLPQLQRLSCSADNATDPYAPRDPALPAGASLESLRWLRLPADVLAHNLPLLTGAQQLEHAVADKCGELPSEQQLAVVHWAGQQRALRSLLLDSWEKSWQEAKAAAAAPHAANQVDEAEEAEEEPPYRPPDFILVEHFKLSALALEAAMQVQRRSPTLDLHFVPASADAMPALFSPWLMMHAPYS